MNPLIDDMTCPAPMAANGQSWNTTTDRVMGGLSTGQSQRQMIGGRTAVRLQGTVSLKNNGGFVQIGLDLASGSGSVDASGWSGIAVTVFGNDEQYNLHVRTSDTHYSWQSYRQTFVARPSWTLLKLPFAGFAPHRTEFPLDFQRLRRISLIAIGREFHADLAVADLRFYL